MLLSNVYLDSISFKSGIQINTGSKSAKLDATVQGVPYWGSLPTSQKFANSPPPSPTKFLSLPPSKVNSPSLNNNCQAINQQKQHF